MPITIEDQLQAEVQSLNARIDTLEKRLAAVEAMLPKTMTTDELFKRQREPAKSSADADF